MSEKLIIKNFGAIREAELDLKRTTLFIGAQGSGKSTLAKLIAIFREPELKSDNFHTFCKDYNIHNFFSKETYLKYVTIDHEVVYQDRKLNLPTDWPANVDVESMEALVKYSKEFVQRFRTLEDKKKKELSEEFEALSQQLKDVSKKIDTFFVASKHSLYIPTERFLISAIADSLMGFFNSDIALPKSIKNFGSRFETARREVDTLKIPALNIEYKFESSQNKVYLDNDTSINLSESASGFQALIPLEVVIEHAIREKRYRQIFIIEEPELNLYPTTQKHLVAYLVEKCTKGNNELVITTHSPYVLSSLNNLLFAYRVVQKNPEQADKVREIIPEAHWVNPEEFVAYNVEDGTARKIFNEKTGLIGENELDSISEDLSGERDELLEIYKSGRKAKP